MRTRRGTIAKTVAFAAIAACAGTAHAAPAAPRQPRIFTPACAAPPRCAQASCLRMGRRAPGCHIPPMGCLIYACKPGGRQTPRLAGAA